MASEPHNRFDQIDPSTETALRTLEGRIEYEFTTPVLLWEALQFPGSMMDWDDDQTNNGLAEVGDTAIALAFASTEYQRNNISDFDLYRQRRDALLLDDKIWKAGKAIGLLKVLQEARYENTQPDGRAGKVVVVEGIMKAIVGAVYMDSGMKAVKKLVTKLSVIEAPA